MTLNSTSRRSLLKAGGAMVIGGVVGGCTATGVNPAVPVAAKLVQDPSQTNPTPVGPGSAPPGEPADVKPTYVAQSSDPVAYAIADNLFWNDIMMEHAMFFQMLMPGREVEAERRQAEEFTRLFARQFELSRDIKTDNYVAFNRATIDLVKRLSDYKKTMRERQATGKVRTLVWPLFFEHTAREADRFVTRLEAYNKRDIELDRAEVVKFWSLTMGEHAAFIAHLLDPDEKLLISQATRLQKSFLEDGFRELPGDEVMKAAVEVLDFKTVGEKGIYAGKIKSIISPPLASHVRREAVRFIDELKRTR